MERRETRAFRLALAVLIGTAAILPQGCAAICRRCQSAPLIAAAGVTLLDDRGAPTTAIRPLENLRARVTGLRPRTAYTLRVVAADGRELSHARLQSGRNGEIPLTTLLFGENLMPCAGEITHVGLTAADAVADETQVARTFASWTESREAQQLSLEVLEGRSVVRRIPVDAVDDGRPVVYAADRRGCARGGLSQRRDDLYVVGRNFPPGSAVRLFVVDDQRRWNPGDRFRDVTGPDGGAEPELVRLSEKQRSFFARVAPRKRLSTGPYDIIARYVPREEIQIDAHDVISAVNDVGVLIQGDATGPHIEQNMTVPATDSVLYWLFQDKYFNTEDVWVAVNPKDRPGGVSGGPQNARIYVVNHLNENQWLDGTTLTDVSGGYEDVPIKGWCRNQNEVRVWEAPLTNGNYDVVVDFAPFGVYDKGQDIVDELDNAGFQVVNPSALAIVYPVNPTRVFPEKEVPTGGKRDDIYVVAKVNPAASGTTIYWDSIDVDDPSANAAPVDPNGASGDDNRGNYGAAPGAPDGDDGQLDGENAGGIASSVTNSGGLAYARLHVTSQPGDNFAVRASTSSSLASYQESAAVTVWRKLHVEVDSMGAPSGTTVAGNITNVAAGPSPGTSTVTVDIGLGDGSGGAGRFQNGTLTALGTSYPVVSNTASTLAVTGTPTSGTSFTLTDDDVVPADVADPDTGDLVRAYARAFILPVFDTGLDTSNAAFDLNTEAAERSTQISSNKATPMSSNDYWTVTVHGGFQEPLTSDNDPNNEGTSRAWALSGVQGVIFLTESIRDWIQTPVADGGAGGVDPDPTCEAGRSPRRQEILVHEVGHLLSLSHWDGAATAADTCGGVMQPSCCPVGDPSVRRSSNFTQQSLQKLRSIAKPN